MKEHGLNIEKKLVLDCAKLCDFLDHPLKLNILKYANEIKKVLSKEIKMVENFICFHLFLFILVMFKCGRRFGVPKTVFWRKKLKLKKYVFFPTFFKKA